MTKAKGTEPKEVVDDGEGEGEDVCPVCGRKGRPPGHH